MSSRIYSFPKIKIFTANILNLEYFRIMSVTFLTKLLGNAFSETYYYICTRNEDKIRNNISSH